MSLTLLIRGRDGGSGGVQIIIERNQNNDEGKLKCLLSEFIWVLEIKSGCLATYQENTLPRSDPIFELFACSIARLLHWKSLLDFSVPG